ncbi:MAG: glycosyltransferase [Sporocytophaga sp.]|uniref:glycosyltransferase family 2 protein n=1 Tax=Sporocytophaga sp. TaxID=2231183 RepID=UPI001B280D48|nr:glycosyltransferase [Sporocytophaga sp.]MBO9699696.1 glycosyltransferase [Sporocytophaga sp.]
MSLDNTPKVSVLIPVYNMESYIEDAINSVLNQTFTHFEIIIVDNKSTDNTYEKLSKYNNNPNIKIYQNERNLGMVQNWNSCLYYAKGEYIKFLNADDILNNRALECFVKILDEHKDVSLVTSHYKSFGDEEKMYITSKGAEKQDGKIAISKLLQTQNYIGCPTQVIFRRDHLYLGTFNIASTWWSDMDLWFRLLLNGNLFIIDEILTQNRSHPTQVSHEFANNKSLLAMYYFYTSLLKSDNYGFCDMILHKKIRDCRFMLYYLGIKDILKGKPSGWQLLKASDNELFSFSSLKLPTFVVRKVFRKVKS